eukprot:GSA120T00022059001.1
MEQRVHRDCGVGFQHTVDLQRAEQVHVLSEQSPHQERVAHSVERPPVRDSGRPVLQRDVVRFGNLLRRQSAEFPPQHDLVSYKQEFQLRIDPLYGFGQVQLKVTGSNLKSLAPELPNCVWNYGTYMTRLTVFNSSYGECDVPLLKDIIPSQAEYDAIELPHDINVDITLDGGETRSYFSVIYQFIAHFQILALSPNRGIWSGGTPLEVLGDFFIKSPQLFCRFGNVEVPAVYVSRLLLTCVAPALPRPTTVDGQTAYPFSYSVDAQRFLPALDENGQQIFWYAMEEPVLDLIKPDIGPYTGDTNVTIRGKFFQDVSYLSCSFGVFITPAFYVNATAVQCVVPPCKDAFGTSISMTDNGFFQACFGTVAVKLTMNQEEFYGNLTFEYTNRQRILQVYPWSTSFEPIDLFVLINGTNFAEEGMYCRWSTPDGSHLDPVKAVEVQKESMRCRVPGLPPKYQIDTSIVQAGSAGAIHDTVIGYLEISPNPDQDYTRDRLPWTWYRPAIVKKVMPETVYHGKPVQGAFVITGRHFRRLDAERELQCQWFADATNPANYELVQAHYQSPTEVRCQPTQAVYSSTGLDISQLNVPTRIEVGMSQLTYSVSQHTVMAEPFVDLVHHYEPSPINPLIQIQFPALDFDYDNLNLGGAPRCIHLGGCTLGLRGHNLWNPMLNHLNKLYVVVGDTIVEARHWFAYPYGSRRKYATFKAPPVPHRADLARNAAVFVTRNLQDLSTARFDYRITYVKLDAGKYYRPELQNGTAIPCPRGHYCEGALQTNFSEWLVPPTEPLPCASGTFQNFTGRGDCKICEEGTTCPETGMGEPIQCAVGYICWTRGGWDAAMPLCPSGILCLRPPYGKSSLYIATTSRIRRLLIASETGDPKYLEQLLDLVQDDEMNDFLSSTQITNAERKVLKENMFKPRLLEKIQRFNESLQAERRAIFASGNDKQSIFGVEGIDTDAAQAKENFLSRKAQAKRLLRQFVLPDGQRYHKSVGAEPPIRKKNIITSHAKNQLYHEYTTTSRSIFDETAKGKVPLDEEEEGEENTLHFYRMMNHYYYDPDELTYIIDSHQAIWEAMDMPERRRALLTNVIGSSIGRGGGEEEGGVRRRAPLEQALRTFGPGRFGSARGRAAANPGDSLPEESRQTGAAGTRCADDHRPTDSGRPVSGGCVLSARVDGAAKCGWVVSGGVREPVRGWCARRERAYPLRWTPPCPRACTSTRSPGYWSPVLPDTAARAGRRPADFPPLAHRGSFWTPRGAVNAGPAPRVPRAPASAGRFRSPVPRGRCASSRVGPARCSTARPGVTACPGPSR